MEEINDSLTDECPQCAIKHLSAAIAWMIEAARPGFPPFAFRDFGVLRERARINVVEARCGYASHFDYAIGLYEQAEEAAASAGRTDEAKAIRSERIALMADGLAPVPFVVPMTPFDDVLDRAYAHFHEAERELPAYFLDAEHSRFAACSQGRLTAEEFIASAQEAIRGIRAEFFSTASEPEEKGEETMATKKVAKVAKAAPAKATKAACKGGKCGGKKCK